MDTSFQTLRWQKEVSAQLQQFIQLQQEIIKTMASIASQLSTVQNNLANLGNLLTNLASGIASLDTLIQSLEAAQSGATSTLSAADQATLTQIISASGALNTQAQAININPPAAPSSGS